MSDDQKPDHRTLGPRIGRRPQQQMAIDLSPAEEAARKAAGVPLDAELTESEIAAREADKVAMLAQANAAIPAEQPPVVAVTALGARLDEIATAQRAATEDARAAQAAGADALARPLLTTAHSLATQLGLLKSTHRDKIADVARRPWADILRAIPNAVTYIERPAPVSDNDGETLGAERAANGLAGAHLRPAFVSNRFYVSELARVARELDGALSNSFTDLAAAAAEVAQFIGRGPEHRGMASERGEQFEVVVGGGTHDPLYGTLSAGFRRAVTHLRVHIERTQRQLDTTNGLLVKFTKLQERVEPLLANLVIEPVAAPPKVLLPPLQTPPAPRGTSSVVQFDPREHPSTWGKEAGDKTGVQKLGEDRFRVGSDRVPEWGPGGKNDVRQVN